MILWAMKLEIDCQSFWEPPAVYWNQQMSLIHPRMQKTVLSFLGKFQYAMAFLQQLFHVCMIRVSLCIYRRLKLGQIFEQKSIGMMMQYLIGNHIFLYFHDWRKLPNLEIFAYLIGTRNCQHIWTMFASQKDWKIKSLYLPTI